MTDQTPPPVYTPPAAPVATGGGQVGKIRGTGVSILLAIVTIGIYELVWFYKTAEERKQYTGQGLGGGISLLIAFFVSPVMLFLTPAEVGNAQAQYGQQKTVSGVTGFWVLLPLVGAIVWFVKVNGAINEFWKSQGATA